MVDLAKVVIPAAMSAGVVVLTPPLASTARTAVDPTNRTPFMSLLLTRSKTLMLAVNLTLFANHRLITARIRRTLCLSKEGGKTVCRLSSAIWRDCRDLVVREVRGKGRGMWVVFDLSIHRSSSRKVPSGRRRRCLLLVRRLRRRMAGRLGRGRVWG